MGVPARTEQDRLNEMIADDITAYGFIGKAGEKVLFSSTFFILQYDYIWKGTIIMTLKHTTKLENYNNLRFEVVNQKNISQIERLEVFPEQKRWIETVSECMKEAEELNLWRPVGIYDDDLLIGFAMYGYFTESFPGQLWLDRLLIDKKYQGKGYGKQAVLALLERMHAEYSSDKVYLSVYESNLNAIRLYQEIGFSFNGKFDTKGELIMEYNLK